MPNITDMGVRARAKAMTPFGSHFIYGDPAAAELVKWAKHDPETTSVVHAAREIASPVTIYVDRWGTPGTPVAEELPESAHEPGRYFNPRGLYQTGSPAIDVRRGPDAAVTLGHELGHHIVNTTTDMMSADQPTREAIADLFARQTGRLQKLDPGSRDFARDYVVEKLGKDITRGNEVDLSSYPSLDDRILAAGLDELAKREPPPSRTPPAHRRSAKR